MTKTTTAIELHKVTLGYGKGYDAISNVSFSIAEGAIAMLIGPNGSGKTTLLKGMVGLLKPRKGSILTYGSEPKAMRNIIGYVPQKINFDPSFPLTVKEFLRSSGRVSDQEIQEVLSQTGILAKLQSRIGALSGGQLQRVLIARSLLGSPQILFLDEPVSGIDVGGEQEFYQLIKEIREHRKITIVMVSHEVHLISDIADQVICVNQKMVCNGAPCDVLSADTMNALYGHKVFVHKHDEK